MSRNRTFIRLKYEPITCRSFYVDERYRIEFNRFKCGLGVAQYPGDHLIRMQTMGWGEIVPELGPQYWIDWGASSPG